jgi:hypothetical protein
MTHSRTILCAAVLSACAAIPLAAQSPPFTVAERAWDLEALGNHRAIVQVSAGRRSRPQS